MEEIRMQEAAQYITYQDYKAAFDAEVKRVELGFVRIGYMLRIAQDTDILRESGYAGMEEFAESEYKIDSSQASRFININKRFSAGGYSDRLQERFEGYGVAKLGELLTLSDQVIEVLPSDLSRSELQEIKKEIREEKKITDLEVMMEETGETDGTLLGKWMEVFFRERPEQFLEIHKLYTAADSQEAACDILAPSGTAAEMARIQGVGKLLLAVKGKDQPIFLLNIRSNEKEEYSWDECIRELGRICPEGQDPREAFERRYGIMYLDPGKKTVTIPVQTVEEGKKKLEQKPEPIRKPEKKRENPSVAPVQLESEKEESIQKPEDTADLAGEPEQMDLGNYDGVVPGNYIVCHNGEEVTEQPESLREEGIRLADEVAQWMRTGTMEYAQQTERMILRLRGIIEEIINEEHN